jgi:hypothetical protein
MHLNGMKRLKLLRNKSIIIAENRNTSEINNRRTKYKEPKHQNNTLIDRKQCSLVALRGKPPTKQRSITIIVKKKTSHALDSYL